MQTQCYICSGLLCSDLAIVLFKPNDPPDIAHRKCCVQVHVFDLAADTNAPLCIQKVVRKAHLTRLAFNPTHPVLVVGDDRQAPLGCSHVQISSCGAAARSLVGCGLAAMLRQVVRHC